LAIPPSSNTHPLILVVDATIEERTAWCVRLRNAGYALAEANDAASTLALVERAGPALVIVGRVGTVQDRLRLAQQATAMQSAPGALVLLWHDESLPAIDAPTLVDFVRLPDDDLFLVQRVRHALLVGDLHRQSRRPAPPYEEALAAANQRLATIVNAAPFAIATVDCAGVVDTWNPAAERIFGWTAAEIVGAPVTERIVEENAIGALCAASTSTPSAEVELRCRRKDGATIDVLFSVAPLRSHDGTLIQLLAVAQDITARKQVEAAERDNRALTEALRDIGHALTSTLDPQKLMDLILDHVGRVVPHDAASIMQISGGFARVTHMRGYPPEIAASIAGEDFSLSHTNMGIMMQTGEPLVVTDVLDDPNWLPMTDLRWIRSYCGMPLKVQGEVFGFLNLDSHTPGWFTQAHADRLQTFATQVSIAIENARLYDALRRDAVELNVLQRATSVLFSNQLMTQSSLEDVGLQVARTVVEEFGQLDCGVMLIDETRTQLIRLARTGRYEAQPSKPLYLDGKGLVPAAARSGNVIYAPDVRLDERYVANVPTTRSELVLPLRTGKRIIGALDLQSAHLDAFSEPDRRTLMSFADQAAAAIENIRLYDRVRRYSADLEERVNERTAELHRIKERVEAILNNSSDAIVMARADGSIQQTNQAFNLLFQYEIDANFGKPLAVLARRDYADQLASGLRQAVHDKQAVRLELVAVTSYGAPFDADIMVSPIQERNEAVLSVVCSIRDITTRKRTEEELRRALQREREVNALKSRFISTASHEFRTPLSLIMTSSDMLLTYGARLDETQKQRRLESIQVEVKNITLLLDDLLMISRASQAGPLEFNPADIDLVDTCEQILRDVQGGIGSEHHFQVTITGDERKARIDSKLLKRILTNLLSNAVKYSPPGSTIQFALVCGADANVIRIQDEGIGIPEADQKKLFEAFHRGGNVGTVPGMGLGLAIVKHAVELHSGTIEVQSHVDAGTTFTLTLPALLPKEDAP